MKGRGRIHPSPATAAASGGDATVVLKLLPAAILALVAVLSAEDKEVLAYLMIQSMMADERQRRRKVDDRAHRPALDCGCFDCYRSFWSRWDGSPDRELIHQAIEGFEEHLPSSEGTVRSRRKDRRVTTVDRAEKFKKSKGKEKKTESETKDNEIPAEIPKEKAEKESEVDKRAEGDNEAAAGEKKRGWTDVMGIFNFRLWSLWSPGD